MTKGLKLVDNFSGLYREYPTPAIIIVPSNQPLIKAFLKSVLYRLYKKGIKAIQLIKNKSGRKKGKTIKLPDTITKNIDIKFAPQLLSSMT